MKKFILMMSCLLPLTAFAGEAQDLAKDPVVEKRMIGIAEDLRCLVCQNESLASSHADLAEDLRREVRELIKKGMSDDEIKAYLVKRYGNFVLYKPPVNNETLLLWFGPFALLLIGGGVLFYQVRKRRSDVPDVPLSNEAERRAAALLNSIEDKA